MNTSQAETVINAVLIALGHARKSSFTILRTPALDCATIDWWISNPRDPLSETRRSRAYLVAYWIIGGERFSATGIPLSDGKFLRPDKGVMKSLLDTGHVAWIAPSSFELTDLGLRQASSEIMLGNRE